MPDLLMRPAAITFAFLPVDRFPVDGTTTMLGESAMDRVTARSQASTAIAGHPTSFGFRTICGGRR